METREKFKNKEVVLALRQPKNLLRTLTSAKFRSDDTTGKIRKGTKKCQRSNCNICLYYLAECESFTLLNGEKWEIPTPITCRSKYVIYHLVCATCKVVSYIGKTNHLRHRTNGHISACRHGDSNDRFDNHVYECKKNESQPYFYLNVMIELNEIKKLLTYENAFHERGMDTMNKFKAKD